jgi:L-alanine-DL-glutamate epimerase-like enolase superfamily enzyme
VETINFKIPWRQQLRKPMKWCGEQGEKGKIHKVYTDEGIVGLCDNPIDVSNIKQLLLGRDPLDLIFDDAVWPLQEAMYDIVAQKLKIPIFKLLGKKCRDKVPACYWIHHFPPDILAEEANLAAERGFKIIKFKTRPYYNIFDQTKAIADATPELAIVPDANGSWWLPTKAANIINKIQKYNIFCVESPIPQGDVTGYLSLRQRIDIPIAIHMGTPDPITAISTGMCDYFVLEVPGVKKTIQYSAIAENASAYQTSSGNFGVGFKLGGRPLWLEGFGRTAVAEAFQIHLAAVIEMALLPGTYFIHLLRQHPLVEDPLKVKDGLVNVPDKPGLGVSLDERALKKYTVK